MQWWRWKPGWSEWKYEWDGWTDESVYTTLHHLGSEEGPIAGRECQVKGEFFVS